MHRRRRTKRCNKRYTIVQIVYSAISLIAQISRSIKSNFSAEDDRSPVSKFPTRRSLEHRNPLKPLFAIALASNDLYDPTAIELLNHCNSPRSHARACAIGAPFHLTSRYYLDDPDTYRAKHSGINIPVWIISVVSELIVNLLSRSKLPSDRGKFEFYSKYDKGIGRVNLLVAPDLPAASP